MRRFSQCLVHLGATLFCAVFANCHGDGRATAPAAVPSAPPPPAGAQTVLAALDANAQLPPPPQSAFTPLPLRALDFGPQGRTDGGGSLHVRFNQPVGALELNDDQKDTPQIQTVPPLKGRTYFQSPELLVFDWEGELSAATRYRATLRGPIVARSGVRLDDSISWEFESPRPQVTGSNPSLAAVEVGRSTPLFLYFDQPTNLGEVKAHAMVHAFPQGNEKAVRSLPHAIAACTEADVKTYELESQAREKNRCFAIRPQPLWPADSQVNVAVTPGLLSTVGPLPLDTPFATHFKTISPFKLERAGCAAATPCGLEPIEITFSQGLSREQWDRIKVSPEPKSFYCDMLGWSNSGFASAQLTGIYMPGQTYTVSIPADLTDAFGQKLGRAVNHQAVFVRRPTMEISDPAGTLSATAKRTIGVSSRYVQMLRVRAVVLEDREFLDLSLGEAKRDAHGKFNDDERQDGEKDRVARFPWPAAGRPLIERTIPLKPTGPTDWASVAIDLGDLLTQARRAVLVEVSAASLVPAVKAALPPPVRGLYRVTDLGPVVVRSQPRSLVLLTRISTRKPVAGASVAVLSETQNVAKPLGTTDANGMLELPGVGDDFMKHGQPGDLFLFTDAQSDDRAYLPLLRGGEAEGGRHNRWRRHAPVSPFAMETAQLRPGERLIARVVTDRDAYQPGERVRVVGWAAIDTPYSASGLVRPPAGTPVSFTLTDSRNQIVARHHTTITREGKFWAELPLPSKGGLGSFDVEALLLGGSTGTTVKVEDFRVPEFSVDAAVSAADVVAQSDSATDITPTVRASANFYFGGAVKIRRASYQHGCSTLNFRPPGLEPSWTVGFYHSDSRHSRAAINVPLATPEAQSAAAQGRIAFTPNRSEQIPGHPNRCTVDVDVGDVSLQSQGAHTGYLIHPAPYYLAVRPPSPAEEGSPLEMLLRAVEYNGKRRGASAVQIEITRHFSAPVFRTEAGKQVFERNEDKVEPFRKLTIDLPREGNDAQVRFTAGLPGSYEMVIKGSKIDHASDARTDASFQVYPRVKKATIVPPHAPSRTTELLLSANEVKPGEPLDVTVRGPRDEHGILFLTRNGLRSTYPLALKADVDTHVALRAEDGWYPRIKVQSLTVRLGYHNFPQVDLQMQDVKMAQDHRRLNVQVDAPSLAQAGAKVPIAVRVSDDHDRPLGGETTRVALWAVDEAVLDLTGYQVPDILHSFTPNDAMRISIKDDFASLLLPFAPILGDPWLNQGMRAVSGSAAGGMGSSRSAGAPSLVSGTQSRQNFEITPLFLADVAVGADGMARTNVQLPDNLTTFRITALASARLVDGESPGRFGMNDARLRVTAPIIVRPALPRILRPGDDAEAAVIVNNLGGPAGELVVSVRLLPADGKNEFAKDAQPALQLLGAAQSKFAVEPGAVVRVPFHLAAERAGRIDIEMVAVLQPKAGGAPLRDAVRIPIPVEVERTLVERVATYGTLASDQPVAIPLVAPADADAAQGGLKLDVSTSLIGDLTNAARALVSYPYGCLEQTASRILPLLSMEELRKGGYLRAEIGDVSEFVDAGVQRILSMQTSNGGFAYWPGGTQPNSYASAYATWILTLANQAGFTVPRSELERAANYLHGLSGSGKGDFDEPLQGIHAAIAAHALAELGEKNSELLEKLFTHRAELPIFGRAFLLLAMQRTQPGDSRAATLGEELLGSVAEAQAVAHVVERVAFNLDSVFYSEARSDAIVLLALLRTRPEHPVLQKLARGLLEKRSGLAWRNTQENAYSLLALVEFAKNFEREKPDLTANAWVGKSLLAQVHLAERTAAPRSAFVPMARLLAPLDGASRDGGSLPVILQRTGAGRMYYRLGLDWSPKSANPPPRAQGLRLSRTLRDARHTLADSEALTAGEAFAFDLQLENRVPLRYLAIDVPLPAGLEVIQTKLHNRVNRLPFDGKQGHFISHEEGWKDRIVLFVDELQPGKHDHTIYLRATTPGRYTLPPARGEAMYTPEVYARSAGGVLEVR